MTELEARERARKIWGEGWFVTRAAMHPGPGQSEWWAETNPPSEVFHAFDCNGGHVTCFHRECRELERRNCA